MLPSDAKAVAIKASPIGRCRRSDDFDTATELRYDYTVNTSARSLRRTRQGLGSANSGKTMASQ